MKKIDKKKIHVLLGMPRAGTTFLYHNLQKHPQIFVPFRRKSNYFAVHYHKPLEWYYDHFKEATPNQVTIDTDTLSFLNNDSFKRYKENYQGGKVILVIRDPALWSISLYKQIKSFTFNMPSFESYVKDGYTLIEDNHEIPYHFKSGQLKEKIEDIISFFGENLLLLDFQLIKKDPLKFLNTIETFLEIETYFSADNFTNERINSGDRKSFKPLNILLRKQWLISLLQKYVPRSFVLKFRNNYDHKSSNQVKKDTTYNPENIQLAKEYYKPDIDYVNDLFSKGEILKGSALKVETNQ